MAFLNILIGFVCLTVGGDLLVRGAVAGAKRLGLSTLLVGLVLVGFGTSTPELFTSIRAVMADAPGLVIGNVIGSNVANILLILGCAAAIAPMYCCRVAFKRDGPVLAVATILCVAVIASGEVSRWAGLLFTGMLIAYIVLTYLSERADNGPSAQMHEGEAALKGSDCLPLPLAVLLGVGGVALVVFGADRMVNGSVTLARGWGISEAIIGLTIVAIGTSLPELATSVMAALRREADVAFGNILGSNLFNLLGILGVTALVRPILVDDAGTAFDLMILGLATAWLIMLVAVKGRLTRTEGTLFLLGYGAYTAFLFARAQGAVT